MARIVSIAEKVSRAEAENEVLTLDNAGCAAILIDKYGRVTRVNRRAALLNKPEPRGLVPGEPSSAFVGSRTRLHQQASEDISPYGAFACRSREAKGERPSSQRRSRTVNDPILSSLFDLPASLRKIAGPLLLPPSSLQRRRSVPAASISGLTMRAKVAR